MLYFFDLFFVGSICYPNIYYRAGKETSAMDTVLVFVADEIILGYFIQWSMPILSGSHPAHSTAGGYLWIHYPSDWAPS